MACTFHTSYCPEECFCRQNEWSFDNLLCIYPVLPYAVICRFEEFSCPADLNILHFLVMLFLRNWDKAFNNHDKKTHQKVKVYLYLYWQMWRTNRDTLDVILPRLVKQQWTFKTKVDHKRLHHKLNPNHANSLIKCPYLWKQGWAVPDTIQAVYNHKQTNQKPFLCR